MRFHCFGLSALLSWLLMLSISVLAQRSDAAQALLRAATDLAQVHGDLPGAIRQYEAIVERFAKTDRATAVHALLGMADAHQKLGHADAAKIYARIVREYPEQIAAVATARTRLAALEPARTPRASGPLCTKCVGPFFHSFTLSPDGRWFGYTDANNNLMSRDLRTGAVTRLVGFPEDSYATRRFRARRPTWSPDARQVAYFFRDTDAPGDVKDRAQLRVLTMGSPAEPRTLVDNPDFVYVFPAGWSPDGLAILVMLQRRDFTWQLGWVSATTGAVTVLRSLDWQFNEFRNGPELSPDGRFIVYATFTGPRRSPGPNEAPTSPNGGPGRSIHILAADGSRDEIVAAAVSGFTSPVWTSGGSRILFLSERDGSGTSDLWASEVRNGQPVGLPTLVKASLGTNVALVGTTRAGLLYYVQPESASRRIVVSALGPSGTTAFSGATTGFAGSGATWSPDGTHLAWLKNGGRSLVVHALETGREETYALPGGAVSSGPSWQQDGTAVLLGLRNTETGQGFAVVRIHLETREARMLGIYAPPSGQMWSGPFTPAPDGSAIYVTATAETGQSHVFAVALATGTVTQILSGVSGALRVQQVARGAVGQAVEVRPEARPVVTVVPRSDGKTVAITLMKDPRAEYLATVDIDGTNYREWYGPVPGRLWNQTVVSRLAYPKWLQNDRGLAFGIQQDDLSWTLMRVAADGGAEPLGAKDSRDATLDPRTLRFDISPDGRRVAHERIMTFSDELWALDLTTLVPKRQR